MQITVSIKHKSHIDELITRHDHFRHLKNLHIAETPKTRWYRGQDETYDLQVIFIGKTGYGKSTTVNSIIGKRIFEFDDNKPCTHECQSAEYVISPCGKHYFSLGDLPGIGESFEKDKKYIDMYSDFLKKTHTTVYILRADTRDFALDIDLFNNLFKSGSENGDRRKIVIGMNFCDKIEPLNRAEQFKPSQEQLKNIDSKIDLVSIIFGIPINRIIPYSAIVGWNINALVRCIVDNLYL